MLPSVKERRRNAPFFYKCYFDICKLRNVMPVSFLKRHGDPNTLDFCGDRFKLEDWIPILEALKCDRSLQFIAMRSKHLEKKVLEEVNMESKARAVKKHPVLLTRYVLHLLMECLATCISESSTVTCLELEGLPLELEYMSILCKGISTNAYLQTISFHGCSIGDTGCKQLCLLIRKMPTVFYLDLSNCNLGDKSAMAVAGMLQYQSLQRYTEGWKQSLRCRDPSLESMPGLRRIILNNNVQIKDNGIKLLAEVLKEDIWLRAIDLQNCGISNEGAHYLLEMLNVNITLYIVDVRDNATIDSFLIHQIMLKLLHNNASESVHEYNWTIPQSQLSRHTAALSRSHNAGVKCNFSMKNPAIRNLKSSVQKQKLKEVIQHLEVETSLRRKAELKQKELRARINELENELLKEKENKEGFCIMKVDAFEAVLDTFRKFSSFIKHIKSANEAIYQEEDYSDNDDTGNTNDTKLLENHVKNVMTLTMQVEDNELRLPSQGFSQEVATSRRETCGEIFTSGNFETWKNVEGNNTSLSERECNKIISSPKEQTSQPEIKFEPSALLYSYISSIIHAENVLNESNVPVVLNNCS